MRGEFAGTLTQSIAIERQIHQRTSAGLQDGGWEEIARCLAAIVPEGTGPEAEGMTLSAMPRFRVTVRRRLDLAVNQRVRWANRCLAVRQILDDPRLADRLTLRCEEVRS